LLDQAPGALPAPLLLRNATLADGKEADVLLRDGAIAAVGPGAGAGQAVAAHHDLQGYVLLPSAVEAHAHLDKAWLADRCPNPAGDLAGAIESVRRAYSTMDEPDIRRRATKALMTAVRHGCTALRAHVNCEPGIGTRALSQICALRDELSALVEVQVVAHMGMPLTGAGGREGRLLLGEALSLGIDLVGGAPDLDPAPVEAMRLLLETAAEAGLGVDLHLDETTCPEVFILDQFAEEVVRRGLAGRATASHCVSLSQQGTPRIERTAARLARAGIGVVVLPQTNLFLQGRDERSWLLRGLTAVGPLRRAGVNVAGGADNVRDPFNPLGRYDPLETAALLVAAAHLSPSDGYAAVSQEARAVLGLTPVAVQPGSPADLLAVRASSLEEAVASASEDRWVFRAGRLVARSRVIQEVDPEVVLRRSPERTCDE
jgi:cytosine deaminase